MVKLRNKEIDLNLEDQLNNIITTAKIKNSVLIKQAVELINVFEKNNETAKSCLNKGLAIAEILSPLKIDEQTIAAAIVYPSIRQGNVGLDDVTDYLGNGISKLIQNVIQMDDVTELSKSTAHTLHHAKIDNLRKMLLAMVNDIRSVFVKLAEHLYLLRCASKSDINTQKTLANQTIAIYAPLANRLGIGSVKWEMEDFAFRYLETEKYKQISKALNQRRLDREQYVQNFIIFLDQLLQHSNIIDKETTGRVKHIYSIYRKMQKKEVDFSQIYDATAVRVMVPKIEDCYHVLSIVHAKWDHVPQEFDDYINTPKKNGYRSIHTVVVGPENRYIEIQIRTHQMHQEAELGGAAHWIYKEGPQKSDYEAKIAWLRQIMDWQKEIADSEKTQEIQHLFDDRVYVFTPNGDIIDLPQGSTPIDFAYHVHSEVGHRCRGAKIDGDMVTLTYQLKTGDRVEILTAKEPRPSRDWLNPSLGFVKSPRARAKIQHWFREQDYDRNIINGQELLEKELRRLNIRNINITNIATKLFYKNPEELFAALGSGESKISSIINLVQRETVPIKEPIIIHKKIGKIDQTKVKIHGIDNALTNIANCCQPVPNEPIIGYITQGRGVTIHHRNCFNVIRANNTKPERLLAVSWANDPSYQAIKLKITAYDRQGLIKDITTIIANENIVLNGLSSKINKDHLADISLSLELKTSILDNFIAKLKQFPELIKVETET